MKKGVLANLFEQFKNICKKSKKTALKKSIQVSNHQIYQRIKSYQISHSIKNVYIEKLPKSDVEIEVGEQIVTSYTSSKYVQGMIMPSR